MQDCDTAIYIGVMVSITQEEQDIEVISKHFEKT